MSGEVEYAPINPAIHHVMHPRVLEGLQDLRVPLLVEGAYLTDAEVKQRLRTYTEPWILDHSIAIGQQLDFDVYVKLVLEMQPPVVVCPDVKGNADSTLGTTGKFLRLLAKASFSGTVMFALQGKDIAEIANAWTKFTALGRDFYSQTGNTYMFGLPYKYDFRMHLRGNKPIEKAMDRVCLVQYLRENVMNREDELHLLGLWHPVEVLLLRDMICSADTSLALKAATLGHSVYAGTRSVQASSAAEFEDIDLAAYFARVMELKEIVNVYHT